MATKKTKSSKGGPRNGKVQDGPPKKLFERRGVNLLSKPGNPAFEIRQILDDLQREHVPELFVSRIKGVVKPMIGHGISEENYKRLMRNMEGCVEKFYPHANPIEALQDYIFRGFILKAAGMGVINSGGRR